MKGDFWLQHLSPDSLPWFQPAWGQALIVWRLSELLASRKQLSWVRKDASLGEFSSLRQKWTWSAPYPTSQRFLITLQWRQVQQSFLIKPWCVRDDVSTADDESLYVTLAAISFKCISSNFWSKHKCIAENNCCWVVLRSGSEILDAEWIQPLRSSGTIYVWALTDLQSWSDCIEGVHMRSEGS